MWFNLLVLFTALIISGVAAYYSIIGLTAIFAAAFWPIVIMGIVLELGKIVASVWLKKYWQQAAWQIKTYLTSAVAVLMLITSMGIFGFLSRAHLEQGVPTAEVAAQVELLDVKIQTQQEKIESARKSLAQLDEQVNQRLIRSTTERAAERSVQIRRQQASERARLQTEISEAQKLILELREQRAPIASELRKVESELGPLKYVAALIYGDEPNATLLERAVRWVIMIIVFVFDPLAIALLLAANSSIRWERDKLQASVSVPSSEIDPPELQSVPEECSDNQIKPQPQQVYLKKPFVQLRSSRPPVVQKTQSDTDPKSQPSSEPSITEPETSESDVKIDNSLWETDNFQGIKNLNAVSFGTQFPSQPRKNDMFLRLDYLPSRLFKFSGSKWLPVESEISDSISPDDKYLDHLIAEIAAGRTSVESLTPREQSLVEKRLKSKINYEK